MAVVAAVLEAEAGSAFSSEANKAMPAKHHTELKHATSSEEAEKAKPAMHYTAFDSATFSEGALMECLRRLGEGQGRLEAQLHRIEQVCIHGLPSKRQDGAAACSEHGAIPALTKGDPPQLPGEEFQQAPQSLGKGVVTQALQEPTNSLEDELLQIEAEQKIAFMNRQQQELVNEHERAHHLLFVARNKAKGWNLDEPRAPVEHDPHADHEARQAGGIKAWLNEQIVNGKFDIAFGGVIVLNAIFMLLSLEEQGEDLGYKNGFVHSGILDHVKAQAPKLHIPEDFFFVADIIFVIIFTVELILRISIRYRTFFKHGWNYLDLLLVGMAYMDLIFSFANFTVLRTVRLVRLTRALRIVRILRSFEPLRILVATAEKSMLSLLWAIVLIGLILLVAAYGMGALVQEQIQNDSNDFEVRQELWRKFGTAGHAYYTFFRWTVTTSWTSDVELLILGVNKYLGFLIFPFIIVVNFALIRVVSALFIRDTFAAAHKDTMTVLEETMKRDNQVIVRLREVFVEFDEDKDGAVTKSQFDEAVIDPRVQFCLRSLEVEPYEAQSLFTLLDNGIGRLSIEELIAGAMELRQGALGKGVDLATARYEAQKTMLVVRSIEQKCSLMLKFMEYTMKRVHSVHENHGIIHEKVGTLHDSLLHAQIIKTELGI